MFNPIWLAICRFRWSCLTFALRYGHASLLLGRYEKLLRKWSVASCYFDFCSPVWPSVSAQLIPDRRLLSPAYLSMFRHSCLWLCHSRSGLCGLVLDLVPHRSLIAAMLHASLLLGRYRNLLRKWSMASCYFDLCLPVWPSVGAQLIPDRRLLSPAHLSMFGHACL